MYPSILCQSIEEFARRALQLTDADLDRPWAWGDYNEEGVRFAFFRTFEELGDLALRTAGLVPQPSRAQRALARYHAAYRDLQAALLGVDAALSERAPAEKEWPVRQALAHMANADFGFFALVHFALDRHRAGTWNEDKIPDEFFDSLLGMEYPAFEALLKGPMPGIQAYHAALHQRILDDLVGITEAELGLPSIYWESYPMPLSFRLGRFESHLRQHTIQVDKTLVALGVGPTEVRRLLRLLYAALADCEGAVLPAPAAILPAWSAAAESITTRCNEIFGK
jgi:hypothetical protein